MARTVTMVVSAVLLALALPLKAQNPAATPPVDPVIEMLHESYQELIKGNTDEALAKATTAIKMDPNRTEAYILRASIYASKKDWAAAQSDYTTAQKQAPHAAIIGFDLAEIQFMQKQYDPARTGFAALTSDPALGDLATFKVFLCDLVAPHPDAAKKEIDALNAVGGNPSYYFANAAWACVHQNPDGARGWLDSAAHIYSDNPRKLSSYSVSMSELGLLPPAKH